MVRVSFLFLSFPDIRIVSFPEDPKMPSLAVRLLQNFFISAISLSLALPGAAASASSPGAAMRIEGVVVDPAGRPIEGALIELRDLPSRHESALLFLRQGLVDPAPTATSATDARGRFGLETALPGVHTLTARAPGRVPMRMLLPIPPGATRLHPPTAVLFADVGSRVEVRGILNGNADRAPIWAEARPSSVLPPRQLAAWSPAPRRARLGAGGVVELPRLPGERLDISIFRPADGRVLERGGVVDTVFSIDGAFAMDGAATNAAPRLHETRVLERAGRPGTDVAALVGAARWPIGLTDRAGRIAVPDALGPIEWLAPDGRARTTAAAVVVHLPPVETTHGVVLRRGAAPLEGALVWPETDPGRAAITGADGRFILPVEPRRAGELARAEAAGFVEVERRAGADETTVDAMAGNDMTLIFDAGRAAFGRVLDLEGRPLEGVEVTAAASGVRDAAVLRARTNVDGHFTLPDLPGGRFDLHAHRADFSPTTVRGLDLAELLALAAEHDASRGAPRDTPVDLGTLLLERGAILRGRVVDAAGEPIPGVAVWTVDPDDERAEALLVRPPRQPPAAFSDPDGAFAAPGMPPDGRRHVLLRAEGYLPRALALVAASDRLEVTLVRAAGTRGRVVDEAGAPVVGAEISLTPPLAITELDTLPNLGREHHHLARTDEHGVFELRGITPGPYDLGVEAEGFVPPSPRLVRIDPAPAESRAEDGELLVTLERGAVLSGRIRTTSGDPVGEAIVLVDGVSGRTDAEGSYRVGGARPGTRQVVVRHPLYREVEREIEIDHGETVLDVELPPGRSVGGRVLDERGAVVSQASVTLLAEDGDGHHQQSARSGEDGDFRFSEVPDGVYRVVAEHPGHALYEKAAALRLGEGLAENTVADLEIVLEHGARVEGTLHGLDFDALAKVSVEARRTGDGTLLEGVARHDGSFEIDDLGSGDWLLLARLEAEGREARARLPIAPGERLLRQDLRFGGARLDGEVLLDGEPLAGAEVELVGEDLNLRRPARADHRGVFKLADLEPGRYRLNVSSLRELISHAQEIVLTAGVESVRVDLESLVLRGLVEDAQSGDPLDGARVDLRLLPQEAGEADEMAGDGLVLVSVSSGPDGRFRVPRLAAGRYRLEVRRDGWAEHREVVRLRHGETGELRVALE